MNLKDYFANTKGRGVFASAGSDGRVTAAIYSTPHLGDDGSAAFIMRDHLTHANLQANPYATYLFIADGPGSHGLRLYLKKLREDSEPTLLAALTRRHLSPEEDQALGPKFIVYFQIEKVLALVGDHSPFPPTV
ncbi:MAG: pyridoxamine 5'-phosphate oxidase family protein [Desulfobulbaceae bacterium]|nr:pyridoxamine 5'-phosphate oxidase family protein [Desulfobulbaceae bacterium]